MEAYLQVDQLEDAMCAAEEAVRLYAKMAQARWLIVPENFLQAAIAINLGSIEGRSVIVEASTNHAHWDSELENPIEDHQLTREGRVDVLILRAPRDVTAIEVKGVKSGWSTFTADAIRLKELADQKKVDFAILVYASGSLSADKLLAEQLEFQKRVGAARGDPEVRFKVADITSKSGRKTTFQISGCCFRPL